MGLFSKRNCVNCGAPIKSEICPYCGAVTGLDSHKVDMEYPAIECKEAHIGFFNFVFPLIFALVFGGVGLTLPITFILEGFTEGMFVAIPFFIVGVTAWCFVLTPLLRYLKVKFFGKEIEATVYGYMNDNVLINGSPAQIVKLLVQTNDGPKFILYQLGDIKQPYGIKTTLKLKVYKDIFLIVNKQQYYF